MNFIEVFCHCEVSVKKEYYTTITITPCNTLMFQLLFKRTEVPQTPNIGKIDIIANMIFKLKIQNNLANDIISRIQPANTLERLYDFMDSGLPLSRLNSMCVLFIFWSICDGSQICSGEITCSPLRAPIDSIPSNLPFISHSTSSVDTSLTFSILFHKFSCSIAIK